MNTWIVIYPYKGVYEAVTVHEPVLYLVTCMKLENVMLNKKSMLHKNAYIEVHL